MCIICTSLHRASGFVIRLVYSVTCMPNIPASEFFWENIINNELIFLLRNFGGASGNDVHSWYMCPAFKSLTCLVLFQVLSFNFPSCRWKNMPLNLRWERKVCDGYCLGNNMLCSTVHVPYNVICIMNLYQQVCHKVIIAFLCSCLASSKRVIAPKDDSALEVFKTFFFRSRLNSRKKPAPNVWVSLPQSVEYCNSTYAEAMS